MCVLDVETEMSVFSLSDEVELPSSTLSSLPRSFCCLLFHNPNDFVFTSSSLSLSMRIDIAISLSIICVVLIPSVRGTTRKMPICIAATTHAFNHTFDTEFTSSFSFLFHSRYIHRSIHIEASQSERRSYLPSSLIRITSIRTNCNIRSMYNIAYILISYQCRNELPRETVRRLLHNFINLSPIHQHTHTHTHTHASRYIYTQPDECTMHN